MSAINSELILHAEFRDRSGAYVSPHTVQGAVLTPSGETVELDFTETGTGIFEASYTPIESGKFYWRVESDENLISAGERSFEVQEQRVVVP